MATNHYFNLYNNKSEQNLVEDLMVEAIQQYGFDGYYLYNDNDQARDLLYGDDPLKRFTSAYPVELYLSNMTGYDGEQEFFSKFGLEIRNSVSVMMAKRTFTQRVPQHITTRPREGDLVYLPFTGSSGKGELYEIKFVQGNKDMFMLGRKNPYFYELHLELFKYSQEFVDTGVTEIDNVAQSAYNVLLNLDPQAAIGDFIAREIAYQSPDGTYANATATGVVTSWDSISNDLALANISGDFTDGAIYGNTSLATGSLVTFDPLQNVDNYVPYDNRMIADGANNIIDTSETNSFGKIGNI
jgi:hypothetical protein